MKETEDYAKQLFYNTKEHMVGNQGPEWSELSTETKNFWLNEAERRIIWREDREVDR